MGNKGQKTSRLRKTIQSTLITALTGRKEVRHYEAGQSLSQLPPNQKRVSMTC